MKVKDEEGTVREVNPRSPVGAALRDAKPGDKAYVGGLAYELVER